MVFLLVILGEAEAAPTVVAIAKDKIENRNILFFILFLSYFLLWSTFKATDYNLVGSLRSTLNSNCLRKKYDSLILIASGENFSTTPP